MSVFFAMETEANGKQTLHVFRGPKALDDRNDWTFNRFSNLAARIPTSRAFARERDVEAFVGDVIVHDSERGTVYRLSEAS